MLGVSLMFAGKLAPAEDGGEKTEATGGGQQVRCHSQTNALNVVILCLACAFIL